MRPTIPRRDHDEPHRSHHPHPTHPVNYAAAHLGRLRFAAQTTSSASSDESI